MACALAAERIWVEKSRYHDAEREYYERLAKLLKGTVSASQNEILPMNSTMDKNKKKSRKMTRKSKSPEDSITSKGALSVSATRTKKQKKAKAADSEGSSNSVPTDVSPNNVREEIPQIVSNVEEMKLKKKKKKKINKDSAEKLANIAISQKENVSPINVSKNDLQDTKEKTKAIKNKGISSNQCTLVSEIAKARQHIKNSLEKMDGIATLAASPASPDVLDRLTAIEKDNADLRKLIDGLKSLYVESENRVNALEQKLANASNINNNK